VITRHAEIAQADPAQFDLAALTRDLRPLLDTIPADNSRNGNSRGDLLNTAVGIVFGSMIENGAFANASAAADWLQENVSVGAPAPGGTDVGPQEAALAGD